MNKRNTPYMNDDRASIGIGAMIVFIALILVAAVASTIIIKTAEELQQRLKQLVMILVMKSRVRFS